VSHIAFALGIKCAKFYSDLFRFDVSIVYVSGGSTFSGHSAQFSLCGMEFYCLTADVHALISLCLYFDNFIHILCFIAFI